ncbi:MAG TPA: hypothetical protein VFM18_11050, partial [Methanosarcina sp.]|nr:hypothetical protein [Methanosarcina sp.]
DGKYFTCFKDTINRRRMQKDTGMVNSSNLCTEIVLNTEPSDNVDPISAVCNLGSINTARVDFRNTEKLKKVVTLAVRMLNNVIDIGHIPHKNGKKFNDREKAVGLGIMGYAEFLAQNNIDFESEEHLYIAAEMMREISYWAINASADLAQERGSYEYFGKSEWAKGVLPYDTAAQAALDLIPEFDPTYGDRDAELRAKTVRGMRNSHILAIAPTATIANICGTTECIQAPTQLVYEKENLSGTFTVVAPTLRYTKYENAKTMRTIATEWVIKAASVRQIHIDQAQSVNFYLPLDRQVKGSEISEWYKLAWRLDLKTTYYLRNKSSADEGEAKKKPLDASAELALANTAPMEEEVPVVFCSIDTPDCEACQ